MVYIYVWYVVYSYIYSWGYNMVKAIYEVGPHLKVAMGL
jgi:hypothetical protein